MTAKELRCELEKLKDDFNISYDYVKSDIKRLMNMHNKIKQLEKRIDNIEAVEELEEKIKRCLLKR